MAELKSHPGKFFEVILKMQVTDDEGVERMTKRTIVEEAVNFSDAETKAIEEMKHYCSGQLDVVNINPAQYCEVFTSEAEEDDKFFKCKLSFITIDEKTEKEKGTKVVYLVQAGSTNRAQQFVDDIMGKTIQDYKTCSISDTPIFDSFFNNKEGSNDENDSK